VTAIVCDAGHLLAVLNERDKLHGTCASFFGESSFPTEVGAGEGRHGATGSFGMILILAGIASWSDAGEVRPVCDGERSW
jgi:hypothetical protein